MNFNINPNLYTQVQDAYEPAYKNESLNNEDKTSTQIEKSENQLLTENLFSSLFVYDEFELGKEDQVQKMLIDNVLKSFNIDPSTSDILLPNDSFSLNMSTQSSNPYSQSVTSTNNALVYSATQEYYEKTSLEFSGQFTVSTPTGTFEIEVNISYTKEYYERNTQEISYMHDNMNPTINLDNSDFDDALKNTKSISLLFDKLHEETMEMNKNLLDFLKEKFMSNKNNHNHNQDTKKVSDFELMVQSSSSEYNMLALQKDGVGIYIESLSYSSSSYSYKETQTNT